MKWLFMLLMLMVFGFLDSARAGLIDRGGGLIYDDDLKITWLKDANYAMTSGYDETGTMSWGEAIAWVSNLEYGGFDDWRLPQSDTCTGKNCTGSEMGHLYYTEDVTSSTHGLFINVQSYTYWSGTEYDSEKAWRFSFSSGDQNFIDKDYKRYAWAVRDGDFTPPVVPEPVSSILFVAGGATFAVRGYFRKKK